MGKVERAGGKVDLNGGAGDVEALRRSNGRAPRGSEMMPALRDSGERPAKDDDSSNQTAMDDRGPALPPHFAVSPDLSKVRAAELMQ